MLRKQIGGSLQLLEIQRKLYSWKFLLRASLGGSDLIAQVDVSLFLERTLSILSSILPSNSLHKVDFSFIRSSDSEGRLWFGK